MSETQPTPVPAVAEPWLTTKRKICLASWAVTVLLAVIILWQNMDTMVVKLLFIKLSMPCAMFLLLMLFLGFLTGLVTPTLLAIRKNRKQQ